MTRITAAQAVERLNAIDVSDPEKAHGEADDILLAVVPPSVKDAYLALVNRSPWWAGA